MNYYLICVILYLENIIVKGVNIMTKPFEADKHFYTVTELLENGLTYYKINKLVSEGKLIKLNKKIYENTEFNGDDSDYSYASAIIPKGRICMMTAARYYGLTTYLPDGIDVAIERNMKPSVLPDWPQINVWYFPEKRYDNGVTVGLENSEKFAIYDIEKTVVDIVYYRNKIGIEETKEILKNYLGREDRDLVKLRRYAEPLGCAKILGTYLEVLL